MNKCLKNIIFKVHMSTLDCLFIVFDYKMNVFLSYTDLKKELAKLDVDIHGNIIDEGNEKSFENLKSATPVKYGKELSKNKLQKQKQLAQEEEL